ncbi:hypothetical protein [Streptomyces sp. NRRL S-455]|nr:hypothetical protein [Streptomyces sp. NRRL S-455]
MPGLPRLAAMPHLPGADPRRAHPDGDGRCTTCASTFIDHLEGSRP